jgi:hypothetical protein
MKLTSNHIMKHSLIWLVSDVRFHLQADILAAYQIVRLSAIDLDEVVSGMISGDDASRNFLLNRCLSYTGVRRKEARVIFGYST